jgi:hypothetical protein
VRIHLGAKDTPDKKSYEKCRVKIMTVAHSGPLHPEKAKQWKFEIAIFYFLGNTFIEISSKKFLLILLIIFLFLNI